MGFEKTTGHLTSVLTATPVQELDRFFEENTGAMANELRPFSEYYRETLREKGIRQQDVFIAADLSEGYGYKLLSEEKRTRQRDLIIKLCLAGHFTLEETQTALKLYGFSPLYPRMRRDAVLLLAVHEGLYDIEKVNMELEKKSLAPLYGHSED